MDVPYLPSDIVEFTLEEVIDSLKRAKTKMSAGPDGIPLKLVKYYGMARPEIYLSIFNQIANSSFPEAWRIARVVAVNKKGDRKNVANYRPVSNLCSLSKVYERCILKRLNECASHLMGPSQHGFRPAHSTTTCLMEIKDNLVEFLDNNQSCIMYSLDLSAAFDMLRKDTLASDLSGQIPSYLINLISDVLSGRKFFVNVNKSNSRIHTLERGCPQGSVLGPVLFNLYVGRVYMSLPPTVKFVAYADDSYVICPGSTVNDAKTLAERTITTHVSKLRDLGMVVNEEKTEVTVFSKKSEPEIIDLDCVGKQLRPLEF